MTTGRCLCGAVSYEANAAPVFGGNCYCTDCQKTSSSHTAVLAFPASAVTIKGEVRAYESSGGSGQPVSRAFCPTCGTQMYSKAQGNPGAILIKAGTLDDTSSFKPMASIYASRAPSWDRPPADIPAFPEAPPQS